MSEKVRRQKDIVKNATSSYINATQTYQDYLDGASAINITYYQIADEASRTDTSLDDTHEVIGAQSSIFYYRIKNLTVYGMSGLDIVTQLTQRSVESFISGDFVITPGTTINPRPGEFFSFEDENNPELTEHLFQITDVQFDKALSSKYYKCTYKLYPSNKDKILSQVIKKFVYNPNGNGNTDGVGDSVLISEESAAQKESINNLIDGLIDKYSELFYNGGMDTFTYQKTLNREGTEFEYYWSPYICHFIYKNKILEKSQTDFLTEIYVQDINETSFPQIYSERGYRKSIYYAVEADDCNILNNITSSFMEIAAYDLNTPLNLPFFSSAEKYKLVDVYYDHNVDFWFGAFNWIYGNEDQLLDKSYLYTDLSQKLLSFDGVSIDTNGDLDISDEAKPVVLDKLYYHATNLDDPNTIDSITYLANNNNSVDILQADIVSLISNVELNENNMDYLIWIIRKYFNHNLTLSETEITKINEYYYENSMRTYLLLPVLIYILQNYEGETDE